MAGRHGAPSPAPSRYEAQPYENYRPRRSGGRRLAFVVLLVLLLAVLGGAAYFYLFPPFYNVTINGNTQSVKRNATLAEAMAEGQIAVVPGNLLAIDGNLCVEGGGTPFTATINGTPVSDASTTLSKDDVVQVGNGTDTMETYTETQEVIPHGQIESDTSANGYWAGSLHVYEKGQDGLMAVRTGDVSGVTLTEQLQAPIDAGYHIYTANVGESQVIGLTFDDGPWPETTDLILDILEANGARATFFTIGEQVPNFASSMQRAAAMGCEICTHSYDHARGSGQGVNLTYMSAEEQINEIEQGYAVLRDTLGAEPPHILRAPGGNYYGDIIYTLEPYVDAEIGWDVDTEDWRRPGADAIYERIMSVQPGQVILMHDGGGEREQTVEALSRALPELVAQGYQMVTISELLAYGH